MRAATILLRIVLALIALGTIKAITVAVWQRAEFEAEFPGVRGGAYSVLIATIALNIVALVGMTFWKRWAVWLFAAMGIVMVVFDTIVGAPNAHRIVVIVSGAIVLSLAWILRVRFGFGPPTPPLRSADRS